MTTTLQQTPAGGRTRLAVIDTDIHPALQSDAALDRYLPARWRRHRETYGLRGPAGGNYPKIVPNAARTDAWPPEGGLPGSSLSFMQSQLLDAWGIEYGVLNFLGEQGKQSNIAFGTALATAANDWQVDTWLDPEPRLRGSIVVAPEDPVAAAAEIDRCAADRRFVQVLLLVRSAEPMGKPRYWPMYEAAERNGLPVGVHFGGGNGHPLTGAGWPSYYLEDHAGMAQAFQAQVASLVLEGVFERFKGLQVVLIEGGFAWLPPLMWRLDAAWSRLREETPDLKRAPSEYLREHLWLTTQPMEEPTNPRHFPDLLDQLAMDDRIFFATDYPHWDFDAPDAAFPVRLSPERERAFLAENARAFYRF